MRGTSGFPVRLRFSKRGKVRFVSHRDVARAFERAFRAEQLPLAFTTGFSPRPKVSFGHALSVGYESVAEYLDVELARPVELDPLPAALSALLPDGVDVAGVVPLAARAPALQESVTGVAYELTVRGADDALTRAVEQGLAAKALPVRSMRKGREVVVDARPGLRKLEVTASSEDGVVLDLEAATQPYGVRPVDVVATLAGEPVDVRVLRTHQWIERGGARLEPLEADLRSRAPEACAS